MNKDALLKTVVVSWSDEDESFVSESPLSDFIGGVGNTEAEALESFKTHVEAHYEAYKKGKHAIYNHSGRPKKNKIRFHAEIKPEIKADLAAFGKTLGISQGEVVEYCFKFATAQHVSKKA
jgi:hypothetical protein